MGGKSTAVFHLKGLLILAICLAFTVVIFWVARIIHATSVLFTSAVAVALSPGKDTTPAGPTVKEDEKRQKNSTEFSWTKKMGFEEGRQISRCRPKCTASKG